MATAYLLVDAVHRDREGVAEALKTLGDIVDSVDIVEDGPHDMIVTLVGESVEAIHSSISAGTSVISGIIRAIFCERLDL